jgi:putative tricarboxylic transport membrane protein
MRLAELLTAAGLMGLGGVVIADAARLGFGWGDEGPRSGFFPFWLAVFLTVTAGTLFVRALRSAPGPPLLTRDKLRSVLTVLGPLAAFVVLIDPPGPWPGLGLYTAGGLYLAFSMRWIGGHRWTIVVPVAVAVPLIAFFVFERWFLVPMPKGPLEAWLGY